MSYRSTTELVFAAIADSTRRRIVDRVARGSLTAGELARGFRISRPAVSKHVRVLVRAGLLRQRREGRHQVYELDATALHIVDRWIAQYRQFWPANLRNLKAYVERPNP